MQLTKDLQSDVFGPHDNGFYRRIWGKILMNLDKASGGQFDLGRQMAPHRLSTAPSRDPAAFHVRGTLPMSGHRGTTVRCNAYQILPSKYLL